MSWYDQFVSWVYQGWSYLTTARWIVIGLGIAFALLAVALFLLSRTKWGQSKPLTKCVALSVLAHVWLLMYALGTRSPLPQGRPDGSDQEVSVSFEEALASDTTAAIQAFEKSMLSTTPPPSSSELGDESDTAEPDETDLSDKLSGDESLADNDQETEQGLAPWQAQLPTDDLLSASIDTDALDSMLAAASESLLQDIELPELDELPPLPEPEPVTEAPLAQPEPAREVVATDAAIAQVASTTHAVASSGMRVQTPTPGPQGGSNRQRPASSVQRNSQAALPEEYRLRQSPSKLQIASAYGADADTEAAVSSALSWLAAAQDDGGAWIAAAHGAGTETNALGHNRYGTGAKADTGITGLALLAFLSAGHTHLDGDYQETVTAGLRSLIDAQMPSGDLSGSKQIGSNPSVVNARMYCHGIATLALAEAYTMTHDIVLREPVLKAAQYTINSQDLRTGGWRYKPRLGGDLSQFGWQAMALKSVQRAGIPIPPDVQRRMAQFLRSCEAGRDGGLATYLPGDGRPSVTMTAEALACNLLLGQQLRPAQRDEAVGALNGNLPGQEQDNVYYWYYATLAMFQLQDENWTAWNRALKRRLLETQTVGGANAGSWEPDKIWGGYGGRVYSTSMSCLCLEVYYRFLPMYHGGGYDRNRTDSNYLAQPPRAPLR